MTLNVIPVSSHQDLIQQLELAAEDHRNRGEEFALLMIRMRHFRQFNLAHGFELGDSFLEIFFNSINQELRTQDAILRSGNAEFLILIKNVFNEGHAILAATKFVSLFNKALDIDGVLLRVSVCVGITIFPDHGQDVLTLLKNTENAMVIAGDNDPAYSIYKDPMDMDQTLNWDVVPDLQTAIDQDELEIYFQPQIEIETGQMHGAEVLLRWQHSDRGNIDPEVFIAAAEKGELIYEITEWLIRAVLWQMKQWVEIEVAPQIAINLSPRILKYPGLVESINNSASIFGSDLSKITLEVTENSLIEDLAYGIQYLEELKSLGVKISIDDFGTGYSSIAYFKKLPADELKIDKSFVSNMVQSEVDQHIVKSIINMAHGFNLKVVAEGIENSETMDMLKNLDCDIGQGYYISKPMPASEFFDLLRHYAEQIESS